MNPAELTTALKDRAHQAGFDACRVAGAGRLDRDGEALAAWLAGDLHASMAWMAKGSEMRSDPRALLPDCRSVVVVAMNYAQPEDPAAGEPENAARAKVARYAQGRDYHRVLGRRLQELSSWLDASTGSSSRSFVDTGPVLERAWAQLSGIGWIGKNANLITRDAGSWLLLGELLTTAELVPDAGPHADFCGSCTACLDACPTQAIVRPGVVDARACISYWTIEHRGSVPEQRRAGNGDWIFGCDVCQDVCPWNRSFTQPRADDSFAWRADLRGLDPIEILGLDERSFRARYSGTALMRAKWEGMRRNACIVLGNRRDSAAKAALERVLDDPDPVVCEHARWALAQIER